MSRRKDFNLPSKFMIPMVGRLKFEDDLFKFHEVLFEKLWDGADAILRCRGYYENRTTGLIVKDFHLLDAPEFIKKVVKEYLLKYGKDLEALKRHKDKDLRRALRCPTVSTPFGGDAA